MANGTNIFNCCSNLFVAILLLKIFVIITAAYILVGHHFNREAENVVIPPIPVALGGLTNSTTNLARGYFEASNTGISVSLVPVATTKSTKTRGYFTTKTRGYFKARNTGISVPSVAVATTKTRGDFTTKTSGYFKARNTGVSIPSLPVATRKTPGYFERKKEVIIFVGIMSAPRLISRRDALRKSWLNQCKEKGIPCLFFSDSQDMHGNKLPDNIYAPLQQEQLLHGDLILAQSPGGINFARRYLWILNWANARYKFEYFLRVDDDYFVCMDRLLLELPHRSREKLYWGYVHCSPPGGIRVDEGFVIVSNDLAQTFLREQNTTLMCHPYGDQAMIMWINNIPGVTYFGDPRVHHAVVKTSKILQYEDICENFLALHGSYPEKLKLFWQHYLSKSTKKKYAIPPITYPCGAMSKTFNYKSFGGMYNAKPRPCRENPTWNIGEFYRGRGG